MTDQQPPIPPTGQGTPPQGGYYTTQQRPYAGQQAYAPTYGYAPVPRTNTLAIIAFVLAFVATPGGIICGYIALSQIKQTGESGHGLALAAVIIGWVSVGLAIVLIVLYIGFFAVLLGTAGVAHHVYGTNA